MSNAVRSSTFQIRPSDAQPAPLPKNIQSIERAAAILRLLSGRTRRLGVVDLAGELGLPKGTVHGLLRTLQHVGFVEQDEETGKYQLGAALLHMGSSYLDGNELRTRALNWSDSLAARTHESVRIGTLHEGQVLIVHHVFRPDDSLPDARRRARCCRPTPARWARSCSPTTPTRPASWRAAGLRELHAGHHHRRRAAGARARARAPARLGGRHRGARQRRGVAARRRSSTAAA